MLIGIGFRQGASCANVFKHIGRSICCSVHGDDFTSEGGKQDLDWFEAEIAKHYEISVSPRLGPGPADAKEGRCLNRVIRWCDGHIEYEADPRQAEKLIAECGLEGTGVKQVATPGVKSSFHELEEDKTLPERLHTAFRGAAARGNYLAADRMDAMFACKEICRWMSKPSEHSWLALKRVCRFFAGKPRLVYKYPQQCVDEVDVYTDTDWAGCPKTRKSTSGGCVMLGRHAIKHWSSTQTSVALSSGEAEFAGVIRGSGQGLGYQALLRDFGVEAHLRVWTDSSAAIGICSRQGLGKLRHLDTHTLWIQQAVRLGRVDLRKVDGEVNPADLFTKHSLSQARLEALVLLHGGEYLDGRAASAPMTRTASSTKTTMASAGKIGSVAGNGKESELSLGSESPAMPHLDHDTENLDAMYPPLEAPADDRMEDLIADRDDGVLQTGLKIAEEIRSDMLVRGRRRRDDGDGMMGLVGELHSAPTSDTAVTEVPGTNNPRLALGPTSRTSRGTNNPRSAPGPTRARRIPLGLASTPTTTTTAATTTTIPLGLASTSTIPLGLASTSVSNGHLRIATTSRRRGACVHVHSGAAISTRTLCTSPTSISSSTTSRPPAESADMSVARCLYVLRASFGSGVFGTQRS